MKYIFFAARLDLLIVIMTAFLLNKKVIWKKYLSMNEIFVSFLKSFSEAVFKNLEKCEENLFWWAASGYKKICT